ncbi:MAG: hypothetical protein MJY56_00065 [Bacteroidales bacterium]|nr:hypothetical protein [Bacteroidales bacterium]
MEKLNFLVCIAAAVTALSCGPEGLDASGARGSGPATHLPGENPGGPKPADTRPQVYLSGVRYPEGYDWRHATDEAEHVVFLLGDGEPLFESSSAPAEADTRLISNGRLFHTITVGDSTIIYADGMRQFAYRALEMTAALEDDGKGHIMTVSEPRSTEASFTYRINGSPKLKKKGLLASEGIRNGVFHYRDNDGRYIIVENGVEREVVEPAAGGTIASVIVHGGKVYAYEKVGPFILIQSEGKGVYIGAPNAIYNSIRLEEWFFHDGKGFLNFVSAKDHKGNPAAVVFRNGNEESHFEGYEFYNILEDGGKLAFILRTYGREEYSIAIGDNPPEPFPDGFVPHSKRAMDYSRGTLRLALDTPEGPVLWQDGKMARYSFNGYIDNIYVL